MCTLNITGALSFLQDIRTILLYWTLNTVDTATDYILHTEHVHNAANYFHTDKLSNVANFPSD